MLFGYSSEGHILSRFDPSLSCYRSQARVFEVSPSLAKHLKGCILLPYMGMKCLGKPLGRRHLLKTGFTPLGYPQCACGKQSQTAGLLWEQEPRQEADRVCFRPSPLSSKEQCCWALAERPETVCSRLLFAKQKFTFIRCAAAAGVTSSFLRPFFKARKQSALSPR